VCYPLFGEEHIQRYRDTDGVQGHDWEGASVLLLTTTGRRTGLPRTAGLIYQEHGDCHVVVASNGGQDFHPNWYLNLRQNPKVHVQVRGEHFDGYATTATPEEKAELWPIMTAIWPRYNVCQRATTREFPVVLLRRG
jgi:deazaflavin-dependent oxidoreductase (nitroreductase family)